MKKSLVGVVLIFILACFLAGCTQLKHGRKVSDSPVVQPEKTSEDPTLSANYHYLESRIHIKNKDYGKAITSLEKAIEKDPDSFILTRDLSRLYLRGNNTEKAVELADRLVRLDPDNVDGLLLYIQLKKDDMAETKQVEILNRILMLDPKNKETFLRLAKIYMEKENNAEALILLKKMVAEFPDYYVAWFYLGEVYLAQKEYDLATANFLKTIELEPELVEPRFQLINIYNMQNKKANNRNISDAYKEILEIEPDNQRAKLGLALHYYKTNMKKKSTELFMELGQSVESDSRLVLIAVEDYISGKKFKDAIIVFSQMLKSDPENSTLNFFTGMAYEANGNYKKAILHYLKIRPDHSQYKKSILNIAFLYKKLGEKQTAINYLEDKYKTRPKDIDIIIYLASFYEDGERYKKAASLLKKGLEDSPENTSLLFRLGAVQDKAGLKEESISAMKKIIEIDPKDASALNYLGYSYADQGINLDEALSLIKRAYEIKP